MFWEQRIERGLRTLQGDPIVRNLGKITNLYSFKKALSIKKIKVVIIMSK